MSRIAFVTCSQYPELTADDRLAAIELQRTGEHVIPAIWRDASIDWAGFDLVVLRSMWDYHLHADEFNGWLDRLEAATSRVWNPVSLARWNADKRYLRELERAGIPIVPTVWYERGDRPDIARVMDEMGWSEAVAKPMVSSTAFRTWRIPRARAADSQTEFHELLFERPAMLQEFMPEFQLQGEWSVTLIDGKHMHTVLKHAVPGDFRVQEEFGGTTEKVAPPEGLVDHALRTAAAAPAPWLYARVDGVRTARGFVVSELEMLEPGLFFANDPGTARQFADAVRAKL